MAEYMRGILFMQSMHILKSESTLEIKRSLKFILKIMKIV